MGRKEKCILPILESPLFMFGQDPKPVATNFMECRPVREIALTTSRPCASSVLNFPAALLLRLDDDALGKWMSE